MRATSFYADHLEPFRKLIVRGFDEARRIEDVESRAACQLIELFVCHSHELIQVERNLVQTALGVNGVRHTEETLPVIDTYVDGLQHKLFFGPQHDPFQFLIQVFVRLQPQNGAVD